MNWIPVRSGDLLSSALEDGTVIVSPSDGKMSVVNEVGAFVWELIDGHNSVEFIVGQVTESFEVSDEQARADVVAFLQAMEEKEMITRNTELDLRGS